MHLFRFVCNKSLYCRLSGGVCLNHIKRIAAPLHIGGATRDYSIPVSHKVITSPPNSISRQRAPGRSEKFLAGNLTDYLIFHQSVNMSSNEGKPADEKA